MVRTNVSDTDSLITDPDPAFGLNTDPDPGFDDQNLKKNYSYRRSLQPSKENIQHFKT